MRGPGQKRQPTPRLNKSHPNPLGDTTDDNSSDYHSPSSVVHTPQTGNRSRRSINRSTTNDRRVPEPDESNRENQRLTRSSTNHSNRSERPSNLPSSPETPQRQEFRQPSRPVTPGPSRPVAAGSSRQAGTNRVNKRKQAKPRNRHGWLKEIKTMQSSHHLLIPKLPFARNVREIMQSMSVQPYRITPEALMALQEATEAYLVFFIEDAFRLALHAKRVTLMNRDMQLVAFLRKNYGIL